MFFTIASVKLHIFAGGGGCQVSDSVCVCALCWEEVEGCVAVVSLLFLFGYFLQISLAE